MGTGFFLGGNLGGANLNKKIGEINKKKKSLKMV